jgi:hypothetical protein
MGCEGIKYWRNELHYTTVALTGPGGAEQARRQYKETRQCNRSVTGGGAFTTLADMTVELKRSGDCTVTGSGTVEQVLHGSTTRGSTAEAGITVQRW